MARVLVTGGQGFLGSHLARALIQRGDSVRLFVRPGADATTPERCDVVQGDIRDAAAVDRAVDGCELVIHTVSNFRRGGSDRAEARAINVGGTANVCAASTRHGVRRLVHCSTIGVHGDVREIPADERSPYNPGDLYQQTKLEGEGAVREAMAQAGLAATIVRPISMYGPGDRRMLKLFRMIRRGRFVMVGNGQALFQPAYIDDVVQGFLLALDHPRALGETFIVGGAEYLPLTDLVRRIAALMGVAPPRLRLPLAPVMAAARICELICVPLGLEPPLHPRRVSFFRNHRAFRIDKARELLGFLPVVGLDEGLRRTIDWYGEQGWL